MMHLDKEVCEYVLKTADASGRVLLALWQRKDDDRPDMSVAEIMLATKLSERTVRKALDHLEDKRWCQWTPIVNEWRYQKSPLGNGLDEEAKRLEGAKYRL